MIGIVCSAFCVVVYGSCLRLSVLFLNVVNGELNQMWCVFCVLRWWNMMRVSWFDLRFVFGVVCVLIFIFVCVGCVLCVVICVLCLCGVNLCVACCVS